MVSTLFNGAVVLELVACTKRMSGVFVSSEVVASASLSEASEPVVCEFVSAALSGSCTDNESNENV